jgi:hypothetical protein
MTKTRALNNHQLKTFVPKKLQKTNHQDVVFIRPPGISYKVRPEDGQHLVLQAAATVQNSYKDQYLQVGIQEHEFAFGSVLEEYKGHRKSGHLGWIDVSPP